MDNNADRIGTQNISKLYERLMQTQNSSEVADRFREIFSDNEFVNNITNTYMDNRWVRYVDLEIDEVLKYMPKLDEALKVIKDNTLSSDSFNKDFLNLESHIGVSVKDRELFSRNIEDLKKRYNLLEVINDAYDDMSKYGEVFFYVVPYDKAIQRLMDNKSKYGSSAINIYANHETGQIITESYDGKNDIMDFSNKIEKDANIKVEFESGIISSIVEQEKEARKTIKAVNESSLTNSYLNEVAMNEQAILNKIHEDDMTFGVDVSNMGHSFDNTFNNDLKTGEKLPVHHRFDHTLHDDMDLPDNYDDTPDGLHDMNRNYSHRINKMNGCIVKKLKRYQVKPIILNEICLGYYYFEFDKGSDIFDQRFNSTGMVNTITGLRSNGRSEAFDAMQRQEELLRFLSNQIASRIDTKFINDNDDLKKEIYYILKYNDDFNQAAISATNIRVTYIPPEDIKHMYFKLDEDTNRGISDLNMSLIPAKIYVAIYITNALAIMTRGNDKRVYYVKQTVESNISKTLLKTINEIKKSNFGVRQIENINSVLNITGRFNDYIIPRGPDGQSPIEFEVMQGQQIEIKTELLNILEEMAINPTGVPIEAIQNRQSPDYAIQLTMSNSKFLRFIYGRQSRTETVFSDFITTIYDLEYGVTDTIDVHLPPPLFINITNTNQLIVNTNDYCENIANIFMADETNDIVRAKFTKNLKIYHLGSYLNINMINRMIDEAKQSTTIDIVSNPDAIEGGE
jgi:hypothetical protein